MDNPIRAVIVEDEPVARDIIRQYSDHVPFLQIVGTFGNAIKTKEFLSENEIDLLFLDINLPALSGIGFLRTLKQPPQVIFTTAYEEHAIEAFELAVCDYLVKPFSLERFIIAVDRAKKNLSEIAEKDSLAEGDAFFIKADGRIYQVKWNECLYAEAKGNYTKIVTIDRTLLTKMPFTQFIDLAAGESFCRTHRSFVVNLKHINYLEGNCVFIREKEIPIAFNYKEVLLSRMGIK